MLEDNKDTCYPIHSCTVYDPNYSIAVGTEITVLMNIALKLRHTDKNTLQDFKSPPQRPK